MNSDSNDQNITGRKRSRKSYPSTDDLSSNQASLTTQSLAHHPKTTYIAPNPNSAVSLAPSLSSSGNIQFDTRLLDIKFPKELENQFVTAIFELGLKHSSPKILIPLLPKSNAELSTEHIKSHLQKYRIHSKRSREEFELFYRTHIQEAFNNWQKTRGWEKILITQEDNPGDASPTSSNADETSEDAVWSSSQQPPQQQQQQVSHHPHHLTPNISNTFSNPAFNEILAYNPIDQFQNESKLSEQDTDHNHNTTIVHQSNYLDVNEQQQKIQRLQSLKESLLKTVNHLEEIKSLGKMAADDCSRFSKNLHSMINI